MTETATAQRPIDAPYYFAALLDDSFDNAVARTVAALEDEGFGIMARIDLKQTFAAKLGVEFRPYTILGACNPRLALEALSIEDRIGTMLPCNVIVQQRDGKVEVAAVDPVASMQAVANPELHEKAALVAAKLMRVISALSD